MGEFVFDRLVANLSLQERQKLLERISKNIPHDGEPLIAVNGESEEVDPIQLLHAKPWYVRVFYKLKSLVTSRSVENLFEDALISKIAQEYHLGSPNCYSHSQGLLLKGLYTELLKLKESARFFFDALDGSMVRDRPAFIAFLGSLNMARSHQRILDEADPATLGEQNLSLPDHDIRLLTNKALETVLQDLGEDERALMYQDVRTLSYLKELSTFLFDRLLSSFTSTHEPSCPAYIVVDQLQVLSNILFSLKAPPSLQVLESLFVFNHQEKMGSQSYDVSQELNVWVGKAQAALLQIRLFNKNIKLPVLIRCITRKPHWRPEALGAGEDWFAVYREFWRKELEAKYSEFIQKRRRDALDGAINALFKTDRLPKIQHIQSESEPWAIPFRYAATMAFLKAFHQQFIVGQTNRFLRPIVVDGQFRKKENRAEFVEAYNELMRIPAAIKGIESKLSPNGEWGASYALAQSEVLALPVKRRKMQGIISQADSAGQELLKTSIQALVSMNTVLMAILGISNSLKYELLENFDDLFSNLGAARAGIDLALQNFDKALQILNELEALDSGRL